MYIFVERLLQTVFLGFAFCMMSKSLFDGFKDIKRGSKK